MASIYKIYALFCKRFRWKDMCMTTNRPINRLEPVQPKPTRGDAERARIGERTIVRLSNRSIWSAPRHVRGLRCMSGRVWVTCENDSRDVVLEPGQWFGTPQGKVVLQAIADSTVEVVGK
jgi:hypothetical protein